jgi:hypothetical protein
VLVSDLTKHRNLRHDPASKIIISDLEPDVVRQDRWDLETISCQNILLYASVAAEPVGIPLHQKL